MISAIVSGKCPKPSLNSLFYDWVRYLQPSGLGAVMKAAEEEDEWITYLINQNWAAPGWGLEYANKKNHWEESTNWAPSNYFGRESPYKHYPISKGGAIGFCLFKGGKSSPPPATYCFWRSQVLDVPEIWHLLLPGSPKSWSVGNSECVLPTCHP